MLQPRKTKYRKNFKGRRKGKSYRGGELNFGEYGLKALEATALRASQIEAARKAVVHATKRGGRLWIRVFPHTAITQKPLAVRMGGGKGAIDHYSATVKPGKILFEMAGVSQELAREALWLAGRKLPIKTIIVEKEKRTVSHEPKE